MHLVDGVDKVKVMGVVNRAGQRGSQAEIGFSAYFLGQKFSRGVEAPLPG